MIKKVNENNTNINTYYLSGGFQYEEIITSTTSQMPQLKFFPHAEGYVNVEQGRSTSYFNYVFNYTDHLGNIRLSYVYAPSIQTTKIIEENHYYAFGLKHTGYNSDQLLWMEDIVTDKMSLRKMFTPKSSGYQYKYNGKELQTELGLNFYDYGARNYDAALGRWLNIDPLAEKYSPSSIYHYSANNPVFFKEVDGRYFVGTNGKRVKIRKRNGIIRLGKNASDDLKSLVDYVNSSGSETAVNQILKTGRNKSRIHVKAEYEVHDSPDQLGYGLNGLHQAHDEEGNPLLWNDEKGNFDGIPAYVEGEEGFTKKLLLQFL